MSPVEHEATCEEVLEESSQLADAATDNSSSPAAFVVRKAGRPPKPSTKWKKTRLVEERQRMQNLYEEGGSDLKLVRNETVNR